jgi:hypothetical protein
MGEFGGGGAERPVASSTKVQLSNAVSQGDGVTGLKLSLPATTGVPNVVSSSSMGILPD